MGAGRVSITHNYFSRWTATVKVTYVPPGHLLGRTPDDDTLAVAVSLSDTPLVTTRLATAPARVFCGSGDHRQPLTDDEALYAL